MLWIMTTCGQYDDVVVQGLEMTSIRTTMWWTTAPRMTWWTTASSGGWLADLPRARVVRRRAHQVLTGFRICRARVGGPPPGPKTTEGMR